jgi:multidrug resistance protein MdtO
MAAQGGALPKISQQIHIDNAGRWFWNQLKKELSPYPGRAWVVGRVTIASTIVMILVMTFRLPGGFLGAIFTFFLSRENPMATFRAGSRTVLAFLAATAYTTITVSMLIADPMTHFLWVALSLFIAFYLIRVMVDYGTAVAYGFMVAGSIPLWDQFTLNVNDRLENTLWITLSVAVGVAVTVVVEFVFRRVHPVTDLTEGIEERLKTVEAVLRHAATNQPLASATDQKLTLYTTVGPSRLRRLITRSDYGARFKSQMNTAIALVGRLMDITGSFQLSLKERSEPISTAERERCRLLADQIAVLSKDLSLRKVPEDIKIPMRDEPSSVHFLFEMERTVAFIPKAFLETEPVNKLIPAPLDDEMRERIFVVDAFSNPTHLQFAIRGTLAAVACYVVYTSIDWTGLSTSLATCFITALSTIGSSRQKQVLRLGGALIGGIIFGMGAQIFVLPYLDIVGFTLLFAFVTAISAWVSTASSRLSYLGVQMALAFYLINLQEFTIQTSLSIARDRVFGVLLGLLAMWLIFDRLWVRDALDEMQTLFSRNLEIVAELAEQLLEEDLVKAIKRMRLLRDQLNAGFLAVTAQADALLFEFGPKRQRKLEIREDVRRWQPSIRTILQLQMTAVQYRAKRSVIEIPEGVSQAYEAFAKDLATVLHALANEIIGKPVGNVPDIKSSATRLQQATKEYYQGFGAVVPPESLDVIELAENLSSVIAPLYEDIHATFASSTFTSPMRRFTSAGRSRLS